MGAVGQMLASFWNYLNTTISGGYVIAIALVCLVQYGFYVHRQTQTRRDAERLRREREGLAGELKVVEKDRMVSRLENHILREFVAETEIDKALGLLLHHFVPAIDQGFAAFIKSSDDAQHPDIVTRSRGLSTTSQNSLRVDRWLRERVLKEGLVVVHGNEMRECELCKHLSRTDRDKSAKVFLASVTHSDGFAFMFMTTSLYPAGADLDQQIELAKRLMASVAGNLKRTYELELQEDQYRITNDVLELRSIADRQFETPAKMLTDFVAKLAEKVNAHRVALRLCGDDVESNKTLRAGKSLPQHSQNAWQTCEDMLVEAGMRFTDARQLDVAALAELGVYSHMRSALLLPLVQRQRHVGVLCLSRESDSAFDHIERQLVDWAREFLAETIRRVLTHAAVEQQARQDGLTELANRRIFDQQLPEIIARTSRTNDKCSLLLLDIDRFKSVNDTYGHPTGDEVLRHVASVLKDQVRQLHPATRPLAARYGGEELAVVLPGVELESARQTAEAIRSAVESASIRHQNHSISVTLSAGVATSPDVAGSASELLTAADAALYSAKEAGRNRVCCTTSTPVQKPHQSLQPATAPQV